MSLPSQLSSSNTATQRIDAVAHQLPTPPPLQMATTNPRPPITCHVLDTTLGKPAAGIDVVLTLHNPSPFRTESWEWRSTTDSDGRVSKWNSASQDIVTLEKAFKEMGGTKRWALTFDVERYFAEKGMKAFYEEVEVKFVVREEQKKEHFHVPVLLGPWGYTTYRGS